MTLNPVQTASYRVHIENLAFNVSKRMLVHYLTQTCHLEFEPCVQMIRKDAGKITGLCSAIFAVGSKDTLLHCVQQLGAARFNDISYLLGPGQFTMNAKEAYLPGAKRLFRPESSTNLSEAATVTFSVSFCILIQSNVCSIGFQPKHYYFRLCIHGGKLRSSKRPAWVIVWEMFNLKRDIWYIYDQFCCAFVIYGSSG